MSDTRATTWIATSLLALALSGFCTPAAQAQAIVPGFDAETLPPNDDLSTGLVPLGFTVDFFGLQFSSLYVNNNGNVTFDQPLAAFTPFDLTSTQTQIIAPFFADVDTRNAGDPVTYGPGTYEGRPAFGVNYINVDYFSSSPNHTNRNSFQVILVDRSDIDVGDFDIIFNYDQIQWEAGTASGSGENGLGGNSARVGYSNGTGNPGTFLELPGSAINGALLDGGPNSLVAGSLNSGVPGRYIFFARDGEIGAGPPEARLIERLNVERWNFGQLPPLKATAQLAAAAAGHSQAMAEDDFFMHCNPDTLTQPEDRIEAAGYVANRTGEVIAAGHRRVDLLVNAWMKSAADRAQILDPLFREAGAGVFLQSDDEPNVRYSIAQTCEPDFELSTAFRRYWTVDFGRRNNRYPVVINREAYRTTECTVDVYIYGEGFAEDMRLSSDGVNWEAWQPYQTNITRTLVGDIESDVRVYAQIRNAGGTVRTAWDDIRLAVDCPFGAFDLIFANGFE